MLAYNLQKKGYEVLKAYDGYDAWQQIESEEPDLLLLDLMMPGIDGWELCRLIRGSQKSKVKEMGIKIRLTKMLKNCNRNVTDDN